jgi:hypothetical protein
MSSGKVRGAVRAGFIVSALAGAAAFAPAPHLWRKAAWGGARSPGAAILLREQWGSRCRGGGGGEWRAAATSQDRPIVSVGVFSDIQHANVPGKVTLLYASLLSLRSLPPCAVPAPLALKH